MNREHWRTHERSASPAPGVSAILLLGLGLMVIMNAAVAESRNIVYIEASTVDGWKLDAFPARTRTERYRFEVLPQYDFDKSLRVNQVLAANTPRPDAVVLQECSVYFPGDMKVYQRMFRSWIDALRARGLRPVIATVVPPARSRGWWQDVKDLIKERILGRPSQLEQVVAFNEWLRALGAERGIPVLDLERLLRVSAEDRHMRAEYNRGDGIHLAPAAYQRLDRDLLEFLDRLEWQAAP